MNSKSICRAILRVTALVVLVGTVSSGPALAQKVYDVFPMEPEDGAYIGGRPVFRIGIDSSDVDWRHREIKYRITLTPEDRDKEEIVLDMMESSDGWAYAGPGEDPGAYYFVRKPLDHGEYTWRTDVYDGLSWIEGTSEFSFFVDTVPPGEVEGLTLDVDPDTRQVTVSWQPVYLDAEGELERIARYHVYRYTVVRLSKMAVRMYEAGVSEETSFVDEDLGASSSKILFYKVRAEDEAGNMPGKKMIVPVKSEDSVE